VVLVVVLVRAVIPTMRLPVVVVVDIPVVAVVVVALVLEEEVDVSTLGHIFPLD